MLQCGIFLRAQARSHPDRAAVVSRERTLTYRELEQESARLANALSRRGITKGARIAVLMKNGVEWALLWYACQKLGAVMAPLHSRLKHDELVRAVSLAGAAALVYGPEFSEAAAAICGACWSVKRTICVGGEGIPSSERWEQLFLRKDDRAVQAPLEGTDPALLLFTSGTTGASKGVLRTQEMVALHGVTLALAAGRSDRPPVMLTTAPLYHTGGLLCLFKMGVMGGTLVLPDRFDPAELPEQIARHRVTQLMLLPPVVYEWLYDGGHWRGCDLSSVEEVCVSAGKCTYEYAMHIFEMFPNCCLRPSWGATETCSVTGMALRREELEADPELIRSVGYVNAMNEVRIVDEQGKEVPEGEIGEAQVRSPMVFSGYLAHTGGGENVFAPGGWFRTGDLMRMDPGTRCYYFMDRKKDMIKTGGENVYAPDVERVIQQHPAVADCAVVAVPDPRYEEGVGAAIVLRPGCTLTPEELTEFCRTHLPSFQKPRYLALLDTLPVNSVGKVQKNVLRDHAAELFRPIF